MSESLFEYRERMGINKQYQEKHYRWGKPESPKFEPVASREFKTMKTSVAGIQLRSWRGAAKLQTRSATELGVLNGIIPYNSMSGNLGGGFYEILAPGCFAKSLDDPDNDPLVLYGHNPENVLGRSSANTARFWEEQDGLHYSARIPDTSVARDMKVLLERGDLSESSCAFYIVKHSWQNQESSRVRIVQEALLVETSVVAFPAYSEAKAGLDQEQIAAEVQRQVAAALANSGFRTRIR